MSEYVFFGTTSFSVDIFVADASSTTGAGLTGLAHDSAGLTAYYRKGAAGTATAIPLDSQTVDGTWTSGGFVEVSSANMAGVYRLDVPNEAIDSLGRVHIVLQGAADMVPVRLRIDCEPVPSNAVYISDSKDTPDRIQDMFQGTGSGLDHVDAPATQRQIERLIRSHRGATSPSVLAGSFTFDVASAGTETNDYQATFQEDGIRHELTIGSASPYILSGYYEFDIGATNIPVGFQWTGIALGKHTSYEIEAYDFASVNWKRIGHIPGTAAADEQAEYIACPRSFVGTGGDAGKVRMRVRAPGGGDAAGFDTDYLLCFADPDWTAARMAAIDNVPTSTDLHDRTLPTDDYFDPDNDTVANVDTVTTNSDMRGTDGAFLATTWSAFVAGISTLAGWLPQVVRDAMKLAPTTGTPATGSVDEHLDDIQARTGLVSGGTPVGPLSHVAEGGRILVKQGDSHLASVGNAINLEASDAEQTLYDRMTDATVDSIKVGFGRDGEADVFVGTVDKSGILHAANITTIPIEIAASETTGKAAVTGYTYDIQLVIGIERVTVIDGQADLVFDNAAAT